METNIINLKFDKSLSCLIGNSYGASIYDTQVKGRMDYSKKNVIVFPKYIDDISMLFIHGFFKNIVSEIGIMEFGDKVDIEVANAELYTKITDNILEM